MCLIHLNDLLYLVQKSSIYRKINHITDFLNCTLLLSAIKSIRAALLHAHVRRLREQLWTESYAVEGAFQKVQRPGSHFPALHPPDSALIGLWCVLDIRIIRRK